MKMKTLTKLLSILAALSGPALTQPLSLQAANFTTGNLAVFQADVASANNTTFSILELDYLTANQPTPVQTISINGTNGPDALRTSGSAGTTGYLSDSDDRTLLVFSAHNATNTSGNANTIVARGVGTLNNSGIFNKAAAYTSTSGQQTRGATTVNNAVFYVGDQNGVYTNGSVLLATANCRGIKSFGGTLYLLQQSSSAAVPVVSTVSANGANITGLPGLTNDPAGLDFYLVSSGSNGTTYDVLYVMAGTSATVGTIKKYSLVSGGWTNNGTFSTGFGGFGICAVTNSSGVALYVTTGNGTTAANRLVQLTDASGYNAALNINAANNVTLYTAAAGTTMKGVAFAPVGGCTPPATPTASNNGPVTAGGTLNLSTPTVVGASYSWTGPNGFLSTNQNPVISNVTAAAAGSYFVTAAIGTCESAAGETVVQIFSAPTVAIIQGDLWAYTNQTATFTTSVMGNPAPTYQWSYNGVELPGEVNPSLSIPLTDTNQSGLYSVVASNTLGKATNTALLTVTFKPNIRITEVMSSQNTNDLNGSTLNHGDWFELSNLGDFPVNIHNFRMDDQEGLLANSVVITNDMIIAPGESVIFIEVIAPNTPAFQTSEFRAWWGLNGSTPKVATYGGSGVGLSSNGDGVTVWNAAASSDADTIDAVTVLAATRGVSFTADANGLNFDGLTLSVEGVNGAYASPIGGDIGSPGFLTASVVPPNASQLTSTAYNAFNFTTQSGYHYAVQYNTNLTTTNWITLTNITASGSLEGFTDGTATNSTRFYRVIATP